LGVKLEQARAFAGDLKPVLGCGRWFRLFASGYQCFEFRVMPRVGNAALEIFDRAGQERGDHRNNCPRCDAQVVFVFRVHFIVIHDHISIPRPTRAHEVIPQRLPMLCRRELPERIKTLQSASRPPTPFENERRDRNVDAITQTKRLMGGQGSGIKEERPFRGQKVVVERFWGNGRCCVSHWGQRR